MIAFELMFVIMFFQGEIQLFHGAVSLLSNLLDELDDQDLFSYKNVYRYSLYSIGGARVDHLGNNR